MRNCTELKLLIIPDVTADAATGTRILTLKGRDAWAVDNLIEAGERGCTPIDNPAPRWSGYVHKARKAGLNIETVTEAHGGDFRGTHARYVLRSRVEVVERKVAA